MTALTLANYPEPVVRLDCPACGRRGQYQRDRLIEQYGADIALPDLLVRLANCERYLDYARPCGARYANLAGRPSPSVNSGSRHSSP